MNGIPLIESIEARGVLGKFDYSINFSESPTGEESNYANDYQKIRIIYSDNGSGKTNLLKSISLLSQFTSQSISKIIKSVPIKYLELVSDSGYYIKLEKSKVIDSQCIIITQEEPEGITIGPEEIENLSRYEEFRFLMDAESEAESFNKLIKIKRDIHNKIGKVNYLDAGRLYQELKEEMVLQEEDFVFKLNNKKDNKDIVSSTIEHLEDKLIKQAFKSSSRTRENGVYAEITQNILKRTGREYSYASATTARTDIDAVIKKIEDNSSLVKKYGILDFSEFNTVRKHIMVIPGQRNAKEFIQLAPAILPYFESMLEKIEIADQSATRIDTFIKSINLLYLGKEIKFSPTEGISLNRNDGVAFSFNDLSSGEKQLLLILANATLAATKNEFFIIDEPEISLGIKWQRRIVEHIYACSSGAEVNILLASHSPLIHADINPNLRIKPRPST